MSGAIESFPICMQAELCEAALAQVAELTPVLSDWILEKYQALQTQLGSGTLNINYAKAPAFAAVTGLPLERVKHLLYRIRTDNIVAGPPRPKHGNQHYYTPGGQLALLTMLGLDASIGYQNKEIKTDPLFRYTKEKVFLLAQNAKAVWSKACIAHYFTVPESDYGVSDSEGNHSNLNMHTVSLSPNDTVVNDETSLTTSGTSKVRTAFVSLDGFIPPPEGNDNQIVSPPSTPEVKKSSSLPLAQSLRFVPKLEPSEQGMK